MDRRSDRRCRDPTRRWACASGTVPIHSTDGGAPMSPAAGETAPPRRLRWSVPAADVSSQQWLDAQDDIAASMRQLIRESIEREGYTDVYNRPVSLKPKVGRPPGSTNMSSSSSASSSDSAAAFPAHSSPGPEAEISDTEKSEQAAATQRAEASSDDSPQSASTSALQRAAHQRREAAAASSPAPEDSQPQRQETAASPTQHRQFDIDEVMSSTRSDSSTDEASAAPSVDDIMRSTRR